jgi:phage-related protein
MIWTVELLDQRVRDELAALPQDIQARFKRIVRIMEEHGLEKMREPYVKHLEGKLWEMRLSGQDQIGRAVYVTVTGRRVVVVHLFVKKTQKTPSSALRIARQRAKEVV